MKDIDFTNYEISYSTLSDRAKERLLDFYREDIKRNSFRGQMRELEDERKRIENDKRKVIENIRAWVNSLFLEDLQFIYDSIHLEEDQARALRNKTRELFTDVKQAVHSIFGGKFETNYDKPPSISAGARDYQNLYQITTQFLKESGAEDSHLQNRLDRAYKFHIEYKSKVAEEEQASMFILKLKSGEIIGNEIESDLTDECISDLEIYAKEKPDLGIHPFFKSAQVRHPSCRKTKNGTEIGYRALETRIKKIRPDIYYRNIKRRKT